LQFPVRCRPAPSPHQAVRGDNTFKTVRVRAADDREQATALLEPLEYDVDGMVRVGVDERFASDRHNWCIRSIGRMKGIEIRPHHRPD
jgi:hypothetical protein